MRVTLSLGALALSQGAWAATTVTPAPSAPSGMAGHVTTMLLGLLAVIGLIFGLAWLLRRLQVTAPRSQQVIDIVGSRAIGPRDRLLLVQVGKEQILIGHTPGTIEALHVLAEPVSVPDGARTPAAPEFAQRLLDAMGKGQKDKRG